MIPKTLSVKVPRWAQFAATFVAGALVATLAFAEIGPIRLHPPGQDSISTSRVEQVTDNGQAAGPQASAAAGPAAAGPGGAQALAKSGLKCQAGANGGSTDVGVTGSTIKLATTEVESGIGAAFLGQVKYAMEAVKNKVNRAGGICGRQLDIQYVDDGWDAQRGAADIQNLVNGGIFAIPVGPSSEGLKLEIDNRDIDHSGVPVVGTDGMLVDQYNDPLVWPVATSTAASARLMVADAYKRGARSFSIVFDTNYRFGQEAGLAFDHEVKRLTGADVPGYPGDATVQSGQTICQAPTSFCGIRANQSGYGAQAKNMQSNHGQYMSMFLEPATALTWMGDPNAPVAADLGDGRAPVKFGVGLGQPLFTYDFGNSCQSACDQMQVWTSYKPDLEQYAGDAAVQQYVSDLHSAKPDADQYNAFTEGGYLGMELLVQALQACGPDLTRANLKRALDAINQQAGLTFTPSIAWRPGNHYANTTMQGWVIQYKGTFGRWRAGDIASDPQPTSGAG